MAKQIKSDQVATRYTEGERAVIEQAASAVGESFGGYVRRVALAAARLSLGPPRPGRPVAPTEPVER